MQNIEIKLKEIHEVGGATIINIVMLQRMENVTNKGRSPYNGRLSDFSFYIDSQISVHWKFNK